MDNVLIEVESNNVVVTGIQAESNNVVVTGIQGPKGVTGPQGPQGPIGPPGPNEIGGFPVSITSAKEKDLLQLKSWSWQNTPQEALTDGGNF